MLEVIDTYDRNPLPPEFASLDSEVGFFSSFFLLFLFGKILPDVSYTDPTGNDGAYERRQG